MSVLERRFWINESQLRELKFLANEENPIFEQILKQDVLEAMICDEHKQLDIYCSICKDDWIIENSTNKEIIANE